MKRVILVVQFVLTVAACTVLGRAQASAADAQRTKLDVGIVADQMRWDYLYRYYDQYGEGGLKRLMKTGYNFESTYINYLPTITAVGHASLFTGSVPSIHGIAANNFLEDGRMVYCCDDATVQTVGSESKAGRMSPRRMLSTTIGDELKVATGFKGKVYGVSLKDRASILPAGHGADGAFWFDYSVCRFITSSYYMDAMPKWADECNATFSGLTKKDITDTPKGNMVVAEMAKAIVAGARLGQDDVCDMLTVSFSSPDVVGHAFGTHHEKTREIYLDLDKRLADIFAFLDKTVGKGQYLVFMSADHGAANDLLTLQKNRIKSGPFFYQKTEKDLKEYLKGKFNTDKRLVIGINAYKVCLDHKSIAEQGLSLCEVKAAALEWLKRDPQFAYVVDLERVSEASIPSALREQIINGYHRHRSGDIQLLVNPAHYDVWGNKIGPGTTHGSWNPYDTHIPFILMGWNIKAGVTTKPMTINDIAATVCALIHIQKPNGCIGAPGL